MRKKGNSLRTGDSKYLLCLEGVNVLKKVKCTNAKTTVNTSDIFAKIAPNM